MRNATEVEVWVVVDERGRYAVGTSEIDAVVSYEEQVADHDPARRLRRVKVMVPVPGRESAACAS